jgi:hypothetical protein
MIATVTPTTLATGVAVAANKKGEIMLRVGEMMIVMPAEKAMDSDAARHPGDCISRRQGNVT